MEQNQVSGFRLSPQQADLWPLYEQNPAFYQTKAEIHLKGELDEKLFAQAWQTAVERQEILRTTFQQMAGVSLPVQTVVDTSTFAPTTASADEVAAFWQTETAVDPLAPIQLQARLHAQDDTTHTLLLTLPAVCADPATIQNLMQEVLAIYAQSDALEEEPLQYIDYSEWQHELLEDEEATEGLDFWQTQALNDVELGILPFSLLDNGETAVHTQTAHLDSSQLQQVASQLNSTPEHLLLANWQALLFRLLGQEKIITTAIFDGRSYEDLADGLGLFARALPVFMPMQQTLAEQCKAVAEQSEQLASWQEYFRWEPYETNQADLTTFLFQFTPTNAQTAGTLQWHIHKISSELAPFRLKLHTSLTETELTLRLSYQTNLLTDAEAKRILTYYQTLLTALLADPNAPIAGIPLLTEAEQQQIKTWNQTAVNLPAHATITSLLEAEGEKYAEQTAVRFGDQTLTYQQLHERANQLAHYLQAQGVQPDSLVGVYLPRSFDMLIAILAILKAGGAYLPLDPTHPAERTQFTVTDTQLSLLLTHSQLPTPDGFAGTSILLDQTELAEQPTTAPAHAVHPQNLAYVIYTSGSTGKPKGTLVTHDGVVNYLSWAKQTYIQADGKGAPLHSPLAFDLTVTSLFLPLLSGQAITLLDEQQGLQAFNSLLQEANQFSFMKITPAHLEALNMQIQALDLTQQTHGLVIGGEALFAQTIQQWRKQAPNTRFWNEYGPTETVVGCCVYEAEETLTSGAIPIGSPIANTQLYILDSHLNPVPAGVAGELYIGGHGVARGYLNRPALTAERFVPNPFQEGTRLYKTGDSVRYLPNNANGTIQYLGRLDQQVKIRGYRVELGEIEAVLRDYEQVQETAVLLPNKRLTAYLVLNETVTTEQMRAYLQPILPDYMIPAEFIRVNQLPLTANGKLDRQALSQMGSRLKSEQAYVPPANELEEKLVEIWQDVLGVAQVGTADNFFELGGDSILNLQVVARVSQLGYKLIPQQLFEYPTIGELATIMVQGSGPMAEQGIVTGEVPLLPIQHWFFAQDWPERHHYNQTILLEVHEPLDETALQTAVTHIQHHHDALRLRFREEDSGWQQMNEDETAVAPLNIIDLSQAEQPSTAITEHATQLQKSLNLAEGPVWQVTLFKLAEDQPQRLLICSHHLVMDGVSWRVLLEDLQLAYQQAVQNTPLQSPPKTTSFKRWAEHLSQQAEQFQSEANYWQEQTADYEPLPTDQIGESSVDSMSQLVAILPAEQTKQLLQEAHKAYNTQMNDLLLTALAETLQLWSGDFSFVVDMEGHGRELQDDEINLARTVGWLTTQYPIKLELPESDELGDHIQTIKKQLRQIPNKGIGYGLLRYLLANSELANTPQPDILFNYLGQLDQALGETGIFAPAKESIGASSGTTGTMSHPIIINASVLNGQLQATWTYSTNQFNEPTIQALANGYIEAIDELVTHCLEQEDSTYAPEDFPDVDINQQQLNKILGKVLGDK